jgi:hypothetical protein
VFSSSLSWIFTIVFALTGIYSLVRLAELASGSDRSGSRGVELSHLVMSIAMIAMAWALTGGPDTPGGVLQLVVFGLFTVWFLARLAMPAPGSTRIGDGYHLVMNAAMVWMVAAMPEIMGMTTGGSAADGGMAGMPGMASMPGMTMPGMDMPATAVGQAGSATPVWVSVVSWVFVALLVGAAVLWAVRIARPAAVGGGCGCAAGTSVSALDAITTETGGGVAVAVAAPAVTAARTTGPRLDATCHLLMSLGMAGMLLAML